MPPIPLHRHTVRKVQKQHTLFITPETKSAISGSSCAHAKIQQQKQCYYMVGKLVFYRYEKCTPICKIIDVQLRPFQRFLSSKLVQKYVENSYASLNNFANGSTLWHILNLRNPRWHILNLSLNPRCSIPNVLFVICVKYVFITYMHTCIHTYIHTYIHCVLHGICWFVCMHWLICILHYSHFHDDCRIFRGKRNKESVFFTERCEKSVIDTFQQRDQTWFFFVCF